MQAAVAGAVWAPFRSAVVYGALGERHEGRGEPGCDMVSARTGPRSQTVTVRVDTPRSSDRRVRCAAEAGRTEARAIPARSNCRRSGPMRSLRLADPHPHVCLLLGTPALPHGPERDDVPGDRGWTGATGYHLSGGCCNEEPSWTCVRGGRQSGMDACRAAVRRTGRKPIPQAVIGPLISPPPP